MASCNRTSGLPVNVRSKSRSSPTSSQRLRRMSKPSRPSCPIQAAPHRRSASHHVEEFGTNSRPTDVFGRPLQNGEKATDFFGRPLGGGTSATSQAPNKTQDGTSAQYLLDSNAPTDKGPVTHGRLRAAPNSALTRDQAYQANRMKHLSMRAVGHIEIVPPTEQKRSCYTRFYSRSSRARSRKR